MSDDKMLKLQGEFKNEKNKELKEIVDDVALQSSENREALQELLIDYRMRHSTSGDSVKKIQDILNVKDSIHNDPIIKKYQEKFQEIKDGSKSADSGGILGGAKKKRNIDLKADEEPSRIICKEGVCTYGEPVEYCERYNCKCYNYEQLHKEKPPEPTEDAELYEMANITQIIEIYDNGHENVFYPDTYKLVLKADLKKIYRKLRRSIHTTHTTLDNLELSVIDTLKLIKKLLGEDKE